jgi:hypothetical protein
MMHACDDSDRPAHHAACHALTPRATVGPGTAATRPRIRPEQPTLHRTPAFRRRGQPRPFVTPTVVARSQLGACDRGTVNTTVVPCPGALRISHRPPMSSRRCRIVSKNRSYTLLAGINFVAGADGGPP